MLLTGVPTLNFTGSTQADLLRLNTNFTAPPAGTGNRLGLLAGEFSGFPNGRRLEDDVTDIEIRAVACGYGTIVGPIIESFGFCNGNANRTPNNVIGDGVDTNAGQSVPLDVPLRRGAQPGLRAHGTQVGTAERLGVRRRTTLLVGGATAAALALGGLVGGVLAESRSAPSSSAAPVALADRALAGAAGGIGASPLVALEAQVRAEPRDATLLDAARIRVSAALAGDRRSLVPSALRGGSAPGRSLRGRGCERDSRARLARAHPARVSRGAGARPPRRAAAARLVASVRRHRRRPRRARPVRRCLCRVRAHGHAPSEPRVVCADRVRTRARRRS